MRTTTATIKKDLGPKPSPTVSVESGEFCWELSVDESEFPERLQNEIAAFMAPHADCKTAELG